MRGPLVSIIIPCYATEPHHVALLRETLQTVSAQSCGDYEAIVVDDGSPIDIASGVEPDERTVVVRQDNAGSAAARNLGISRSRGGCLLFLDADDHLLPPALETGLETLAAHPECGFVVGAREEMTYDGRPVPWAVAPPPRQTRLYTALLGFEWYIIPPSSVMVRRQVVEDLGGFRDPWGADDLDFYLRAAFRYAAWCYQAPAVTRYRRYSASSSRDGERMLRSIRAVYARQWPVVAGDPEMEAAHDRGLHQLTEIFRDCLVENIDDAVRSGNYDRAARCTRLLVEERHQAPPA